jgi:transposase
MPRTILTDDHWLKLLPIMLQEKIYHKPGLRNTLEGILYRMRTGCPWRDLPEAFGHWNSVYKCFNNWSMKGKLMNIFTILIDEPDLEWEFIDGSIVKAHQHAAGAVSTDNEAIGKSRGGNSTKIHLAVDSYGLPIAFHITGGEVHDSKAAPELIASLPKGKYVIADKGYDSEKLRQQIREREMIPMIPRKENSKTGNEDMDWCLYKYRHLVENFFGKLKHYRAIATRYDKLKRNYASMIALACALSWLPM